MGTFVALYENFASTAIFTGGDWETTMPLSNLVDRDLGTVARSVDPLAASTQFVVDFGIVRPVGGLAIGPTNLDPGAQYRIRSYEDAGLTDLLYDSGIKAVSGDTVDSLDLEWEDPGFWYGLLDEDFPAQWIIEVIPEADSALGAAQYWKIEIINTGNADGFVEIGYCMIGRSFRPSLNYDENNEFTRVQMTDVIESLGGRRDYWSRGSRRTLRVTWWRLDDTEGWSDIYRMMTNLGIDKPFFVIPDPDDTANIQKRSFLATFKQSPALRLIIADGVTTGFDMEEVL